MTSTSLLDFNIKKNTVQNCMLNKWEKEQIKNLSITELKKTQAVQLWTVRDQIYINADFPWCFSYTLLV